MIIGCNSSDPKPKDIGLNYFPIQKGLYHIYTVDEIRHVELTTEPETLSYELLTEVVDSFPDTNGEFTYVVHRSTRDNENSDWHFLDTWSTRVTKGEGIVSIENTPYVNLLFPIKTGTSCKYIGKVGSDNRENFSPVLVILKNICSVVDEIVRHIGINPAFINNILKRL